MQENEHFVTPESYFFAATHVILKPETPPSRRCLFLFGSVVIVIVQVSTIAGVSVGAEHAPCNVRLDGMDPCSNGLWCGPSVTGNGMECLFCQVPSPPLDHRAYASCNATDAQAYGVFAGTGGAGLEADCVQGPPRCFPRRTPV